MRIAMFKGDSRYDAANSFTESLGEAFAAAGVTPMYVDLRAPKATLGEQLSAVCDAADVIALFGFDALGSGVKVDQLPLHQALSVPFISYLLDHPLFHAQRLSNLYDQPVLCQDAAHTRFLESFGMPQAYLAPGAGATPPDYYSAPRWADRPGLALFAGTYEPLDALRRRLADVVAADRAATDADIPPLTDAFEALADEGPFYNDDAVADAAALHPATFSVQQFLGISAHYTTLLQCLVAWHKAKLRDALLRRLDDDGLSVDLAGYGWETAGFSRHRSIGALSFPELHRLAPTYRFVLNIGSMLGEGLHHSAAMGALAGAVVCTENAGPIANGLTSSGAALGFQPGDIAALTDAVRRIDRQPDGAAMAALGRENALFNHAWGVRARQIMGILGY